MLDNPQTKPWIHVLGRCFLWGRGWFSDSQIGTQGWYKTNNIQTPYHDGDLKLTTEKENTQSLHTLHLYSKMVLFLKKLECSCSLMQSRKANSWSIVIYNAKSGLINIPLLINLLLPKKMQFKNRWSPRINNPFGLPPINQTPVLKSIYFIQQFYFFPNYFYLFVIIIVILKV